MDITMLDPIKAVLEKFNTVGNFFCGFTEDEVLIQFSISDVNELYRIMKAFFSGARKWECGLTGWADKQYPSSVFASFHTSIKGMTKSDVKREIDYKVCLLKM